MVVICSDWIVCVRVHMLLHLPALLKESLEYYEFQLGDTVQREGSMGSCGPS